MKLLLCAASARALAESAKKAGYEFASLDFFGDVDTKEAGRNYSLREFGDSYSTESLYNRALGLDFTHVVYGAGFENYPELVEGFEKRALVVGNDSKTLRHVRDWRNFFSNLEKAGIKFPKTEIVRAGNAQVSNGKILKSKKTGGGHRIHTSGEMFDADEEVLSQDLISGTLISTCIVGDGNECRFLGATEQIAAPDYLYLGNIAPLETTKEVEETSVVIGEIFNLRGVNGIDFIMAKDGPYALEVNPRPTGAMEVLEMAYGVNMLDMHVKACKGDLDFKTTRKGRFYGKKIIYAADRTKFSLTKRPIFIKDVPHDGYIEEGGPVCTVIASGATIDECKGDLAKKEKKYENLRQENL
ncbi:ATP-grasp domain-containing protein [archaeon]|nr:ATP-grasp domain-containing protein [archaeon]